MPIRRALTPSVVGAFLLLSQPLAGQSAAPPREVLFYGPPAAIISAGVVIPAGRAVVWTSGTTPPLLRPDLAVGHPDRFGDTKAQAAAILKDVETQLETRGLAMRDVVYVRAYLVPDPAKASTIDVAGWNAAFTDTFGTAVTPTKPARSTVGVVALVNPEWLVELEVFAAYPR